METEHEPAPPPPPEPAPGPATTAVPPVEPVPASPLKLYAKLAALLFVLGYSIAFIVGNDRRIPVDFVFTTARVSLIWTILLLLLVGLAGGALGSQLYRHRRSKQARQP